MIAADFWDGIQGIVLGSLLFGGWVIVAVVNSVAKNCRKARESAHLAGLKQSMIERGMSADEIERVVRAVPAGTEADDEPPLVALTTKLAEHEVAAPVIEEIVGLFRATDPQGQRTLAQAVGLMLDHGADAERLLALVRSLARPAPQAAAVVRKHRFTDEPASFR